MFPASKAGRVNQRYTTIGAHKCFWTAKLRLARFQRREKAIAELALGFSTAVVWQPRRQISSDNCRVTVPVGAKGVDNLCRNIPFRLNCCCRVVRGHKRESGCSMYKKLRVQPHTPSLSLSLLLVLSIALSPLLSCPSACLALTIPQHPSL